MNPRNAFLKEMGKSGFYDFTKEPFSFRTKDFEPLAGVKYMLREFIPKLTHGREVRENKHLPDVESTNRFCAYA